MPQEIVGASLGSLAEKATETSGDESVFDRVKPAVTHGDYRTAVTRAALKLAGARQSTSPTTLDYARAKSAVDKTLVARGLGIRIPHARPGRVTR